MKKILYIGNRLRSKSVTATSVDTLGKFLEQEGYEVYFSSSKKNKLSRLLDMCFTVVQQRKHIDVVLIDTYSTTNFYYAVLVGSLCRFYGLKYIPILHGGNLKKRLKENPRLCKDLFGKAKVNIAPSGYMYSLFTKAGFTNVQYIPNSIALKNYPYTEKRTAPKLLWVRSFAGFYNPEMALQVLKRLQKHFPDIHLCMVGPDKDGTLGICKQFAAENNLPVTFTGKLSKEKWIAMAREYTVFLNTTSIDNTPVSVIEAMALGLAVVSTDVGGIPYLLKDGKNALLVAPGDVSAMTAAVQQLLTNESERKRLCDNGRSLVTQFDWQQVKYRWDAVFQ